MVLVTTCMSKWQGRCLEIRLTELCLECLFTEAVSIAWYLVNLHQVHLCIVECSWETKEPHNEYYFEPYRLRFRATELYWNSLGFKGKLTDLGSQMQGNYRL